MRAAIIGEIVRALADVFVAWRERKRADYAAAVAQKADIDRRHVPR